MKNSTAIAASIGAVMFAAAGSGLLYVTSADSTPAAVAPSEIVIEYVDQSGDVVTIDPTVVGVQPTPVQDSTTPPSDPEQAASQSPEYGDAYEEDHDDDEYEGDEYEGDEYEGEEDDDYEDDD